MAVFLVLSLFVFPSLYFALTIDGQRRPFLECVYFSVVTMTTTGYGDVLPKGVGRAIACVEIFSGLAILSVWLALSFSVLSARE